jgi:hypothetical protein
MDSYGKFNPGELPLEIQAKILGEVAREAYDFSVSFVLNKQVCGSGTIIRAGGKVGILTAAHVADLFTGRSEQNVGMVIAKHPHQFILYPQIIERVDYLGKKGPTDESGPDISFLRILSLEHLGTICARKSVYRLDGKSFSQFGEFPMDLAIWFVTGAPDEFAYRESLPGYADGILNSTIFSGAARFSHLEAGGPYDILKLKIPAGNSDYPGDYGGISGGGIWFSRFLISPDKRIETITKDSPFLAGVAFCQSGVDEDGYRTIIAHGPASIYDYVSAL